MPIRSGIGFGEAQVYSQPMDIVNTYGKILQKQAQDDAKFQEEMADLLSKVKTDGVRDIDKPLIAKGYEELKDIYRQATSIRDSRERNLVRSQLVSGIQSLNEASARSAEEAKLYANTLNTIATTGEYMYDKSKLDAFKQRLMTPITQLTAYNPLDLQKLPDDSIRDKAFDNIYTEVKNKGVYKTKNLGGGKEQEILVVDPNVLKATIAERVSKNPGWKNLAVTTYMEQNPGEPLDLVKAIENETNLYMQRKGNEYISAPTRIPKATGSGVQQAVYDRGALLDKLMNRVPGSDREFLEVSSLPYGTDVKFVDVRNRKGDVIKKLFKVVVPKSGWESAVASNPLLAQYGFGTDDASGKTKVFEFDVTSPDARRGLNVFVDQFSSGKNVPYKDVKRNNPTPTQTTKQAKKAKTKINY